jgi:DNA-binding transcriptional ArsR family regulator
MSKSILPNLQQRLANPRITNRDWQGISLDEFLEQEEHEEQPVPVNRSQVLERLEMYIGSQGGIKDDEFTRAQFAEHFGITPKYAGKHLMGLEADGVITSRYVGRTKVYRLADGV